MKIQPQYPIKKNKKPTQEQLAQAFDKSTRTIRRWLKPRAIPRLGRKLKIMGRNMSALISVASAVKNLSQKKMAEHISFIMGGQPISQSTISRALKRKSVSYKKAAKQYSEQDLKKAKQFIVDNYHFLSSPSLYALDECGFNLGAAPRYAYAKKGQRVVIPRPGQRGSNYTLILLIQNIKNKGVVHYQLIKGGAKSEDFHDFLKDVDFPINRENYLLLDNAKIHHANEACIKKDRLPIKELAKLKNVILKYLVAYSPQLNPAELCFGFIRHYIETKQPRTEEKLKLVIEEAIALLQEKDLSEYFRHCWDNFDKEKDKSSKRTDPNYWYRRNEKITEPWKTIHPQIYPSWQWLRLGKTPRPKDIDLAKKRIENRFAKSIKL